METWSKFRKKRPVEAVQSASVVSIGWLIFRNDDRKFFTSLYQKQQSISYQPCCPRRGPIVQWKDQLPSKKSVVPVDCLATTVESV
jgi:hypothetical protein